MRIIYHIVSNKEFKKAESSGYYIPDDFDKDGYIHCSYAEQVCPIADTFYSDKTDLILLEIDPDALVCEVKDEDFYVKGDFYPHIYGSIPMAAVIAKHPFKKDKNGQYLLPPYITE